MPQEEEEEVEEIFDSLPEFESTAYTPRYVIYVAIILPILNLFVLPVLLALYIDISHIRENHWVLYQYLIAIAVGSMLASITTFATWARLAFKCPARYFDPDACVLPASEDHEVPFSDIWQKSGWQRSKLPRREMIYIYSAYVQIIYIFVVCVVTTCIIGFQIGFSTPARPPQPLSTKPGAAVVVLS